MEIADSVVPIYDLEAVREKKLKIQLVIMNAIIKRATLITLHVEGNTAIWNKLVIHSALTMVFATWSVDR